MFPAIQKASVFGSRAESRQSACSDVDIALYGSLGAIEAETVRCELDELPFIYKFDIVAYNSLSSVTLKEHIDKAGVVIYER
jgi:predicted nucleotidyltransferase